MNSVAIIIVNFNGYHHTRKLVETIAQHSPASEVIIVDNNSTDESRRLLPAEFPHIKLLSLPENRGFGVANNTGAAVAAARHLFFLNNDSLLLEDTPSILAAVLSKESSVGICGPMLLNEDKTFQLSFGNDPSIWSERKTRRLRKKNQQRKLDLGEFQTGDPHPIDVHWVTGAALMIRRDVFQEVGGFDETFFMYFEDADLCRRVRKLGLKILYAPSTKVVHFGGDKELNPASKIALEYRRSQLHYYRKHVGAIACFLLRSYLLCKFSFRWLLSLIGAGSSRAVAAEVVKITLRGV